MNFKCGHPDTPENIYKVGRGRTRCRTCHLAWRTKHDATYGPRVRGKKRLPPEEVEMAAEQIAQPPQRDPLALRRFSWED